MIYSLFSWFVVFIFWLPTAIGGWLVYFNLISAGEMWLASLVISSVIALYMAWYDMEEKP